MGVDGFVAISTAAAAVGIIGLVAVPKPPLLEFTDPGSSVDMYVLVAALAVVPLLLTPGLGKTSGVVGLLTVFHVDLPGAGKEAAVMGEGSGASVRVIESLALAKSRRCDGWEVRPISGEGGVVVVFDGDDEDDAGLFPLLMFLLLWLLLSLVAVVAVMVLLLSSATKRDSDGGEGVFPFFWLL